MRSVRFATGSNLTGWGSSLFDAESGAELRGVRRITATAEVDDITTVEAEFVSAEVDIKGVLRAMIADPGSGDLKQIAKITYADGTEWEA
jgi:hypothetical protein